MSEGVLATDGARIPPRLDFTGRPSRHLIDLPPDLMHLDDLALRLTDVEDHAVLPSPGFADDLVSIARAWRFAPDGPLVGGVRVVLVEVAPFSGAFDVAGKLQRDLAGRGVVDPQVEVFWSGEELPPYHRAALAGSALLWRRSGEDG